MKYEIFIFLLSSFIFHLSSFILHISYFIFLLMRLENKVALITGAGSGIGRETAILFAREGAAICVVDVNNAAGQQTVDMLTGAGGKAMYVRADVSKAADCENMVTQTEQAFGKLNVMFNNAGISHKDDDDAVNTTEEVWDLTFQINVKGVFLGCKYGIPALRRAGVLLDDEGVLTALSPSSRPEPEGRSGGT